MTPDVIQAAENAQGFFLESKHSKFAKHASRPALQFAIVSIDRPWSDSDSRFDREWFQIARRIFRVFRRSQSSAVEQCDSPPPEQIANPSFAGFPAIASAFSGQFPIGVIARQSRLPNSRGRRTRLEMPSIASREGVRVRGSAEAGLFPRDGPSAVPRNPPARQGGERGPFLDHPAAKG